MLKQVKPYLIIACHDEMKVQLLNAPSMEKEAVLRRLYER
ncbi:hypothetical protein DFO69_3677 [Bacillus subtilis]|nr:hypothetical protein DFO69_3677 [Bacillus subtilis]